MRSSYRGITVLSHPGKVYSLVLKSKVQLLFVPWIQWEHCSFCPGCGTLDQLYNLAKALEGALKFALPVYMYFVDLDRADHVC